MSVFAEYVTIRKYLNNSPMSVFAEYVSVKEYLMTVVCQYLLNM